MFLIMQCKVFYVLVYRVMWRVECVCVQGHVESKMKLEDVDEKGNVTTTATSDRKPIAGNFKIIL